LLREPKWGHLRDLHKAIKLCEPALVSVDPTVSSLGSNQEAHVFKTRSGIRIDPNEGFLKSGQWPLLTIFSAGHALHVFINGQLSGTVYGSLDHPKLTFSKYVNLRPGVNKLSMLSVAVGLSNVGVHYETWNAGVLGPVTLKGLNEGTRDMSGYRWSYKVGLKGEAMNLHSVSGSSSVEWVTGSLVAQKQPLTWYKSPKSPLSLHLMAPKPVTSPVPEAWYSTIALSVIAPMASSLPLRFSSMKLHLLEKSVFWPRNLLEVQSPLSSWYAEFGGPIPYRPVEDLAFSVAKFVQNGGSMFNYYMMTPVTSFGWQSYKEEIVTPYAQDTITKNGLVEQVHLTWDTTDYLWYMTDIKIDPSEGFLKGGEWPLLTIFSAGHALHVFINGQLFGTVYGSLENPKLTFSKYVELKAGDNKLAILSVSIGLPNVGLYFDTWNVGVLGPVTLKGLQEGTRDMSGYKWSYKVGLRGELMNLHSVRGSNSVRWAKGKWLVEKEPLTWYRTTFITPGGNEPLALDLSTMGKGQIWVNGRSIGRYFSGYIAHNGCNNCTYPGIFTEKKCLTNCGESSQRWYHVPREWLLSSGNLLVVFEEFGGNPGGISLVKRTTV
ncbi:hypothetical protein SDJN02_15663, partial [Cucurbita argyrosperma subsp. argyrosperma]